MENIEFSPIQLSLAGEISVSQKNNILTDRIILQISGRKQISAQTVINGTTVHLRVDNVDKNGSRLEADWICNELFISSDLILCIL